MEGLQERNLQECLITLKHPHKNGKPLHKYSDAQADLGRSQSGRRIPAWVMIDANSDMPQFWFMGSGPKAQKQENSAYLVFPQGYTVSWLSLGVSRPKEIKLRLEHAQIIIFYSST